MSPSPEGIDRMSYMEIIRSGAEAGLLTNVRGFQNYREVQALFRSRSGGYGRASSAVTGPGTIGR